MHELEFRKYPYPYQSMLAICSDLDETRTAHDYFSIGEFLNTDHRTPIGTGIGLEVGNTIYFDMPGEQFAYWNTDSEARSKIHALIRSGHIDCFHSYGDLAKTREDAARSLGALEKNNCMLSVWVDHARAPTNFGPGIMFGQGDVAKSPAFHADLTANHGVKYVWTGRVTSMIGQNTKYRLFDMSNGQHPVLSTRTAAKDYAKKLLASATGSRYRMHYKNKLIRKVELRSGQSLLEFMRCNPHPRGVSAGDNSRGIAEVLTTRYLDRLVDSAGSAILYTHLGKQVVPGRIFERKTVEAFELLAAYARDGRTLVTTTKKLLDYAAVQSVLNCEVQHKHGLNVVQIRTPADSSVDGITFYWDMPRPQVFVNGSLCTNFRTNSADESGRRSISLPWKKLEWGL